MDFLVLGQVQDIEPIAVGHGIRELRRLNRYYGRANWRKLKGRAKVRLPDATVRMAEVHWYEGHGRGRQEMKIKRYLD